MKRIRNTGGNPRKQVSTGRPMETKVRRKWIIEELLLLKTTGSIRIPVPRYFETGEMTEEIHVNSAPHTNKSISEKRFLF